MLRELIDSWPQSYDGRVLLLEGDDGAIERFPKVGFIGVRLSDFTAVGIDRVAKVERLGSGAAGDFDTLSATLQEEGAEAGVNLT